ncbi:2-nitropropane dioxygenase (plasmid) [Rhodococcus ruber]|nr:2-nitropropane dioxygenase [Rhodococcus ruber]
MGTPTLRLSGSIAHGRFIPAAQAVDADLTYIGSALIATDEASADRRYKPMIVDSAAAGLVHSNLFTGVHGNYLRGSIEATGMTRTTWPCRIRRRRILG